MERGANRVIRTHQVVAPAMVGHNWNQGSISDENFPKNQTSKIMEAYREACRKECMRGI
jgi:hypothetical protein